MGKRETFRTECALEVAEQGKDQALKKQSERWLNQANLKKYSYHFEWMGRPIIQYPQDIIAMQEIVWQVKPDLIIETGIAHGGSLIYYASLLELISVSGHGEGEVVGIDVDIRKHNREAIESHPMFHRISLIEGSSVAPEVIDRVRKCTSGKKRVLIILDSNHTHDHVLSELVAYAPLTSKGSYCVVFDTVIEDLPDDMFTDRPWSKGNNPKTAVREYLRTHPEFEVDRAIQHKLLITVAPEGYLKRVKNKISGSVPNAYSGGPGQSCRLAEE